MSLHLWMRAALVAALGSLVALIVAACGSSSMQASGQQQIRHVFVITLENENYATTFGANTKAPYLATTLTAQGAFVQQYYGTGHVSLDNYIAMISGQSSTADTANDCMTYADLKLTGMTSDGQAIGTGCVYPASIKTLPDQLTAAGFTWKGYEEDMGNDPSREAATCGHPTLNTVDLTQAAQAPSAAVPAGDQYATRHNPFVYFHSIIDSPDCARNVVNLNNLANDLKSISTTANFNLITPNLCNDGHDAPCVNGQPGGLTSADAFLKKWVPLITSSPAFQQDGLLIINFDESSYASVAQPSPGVTDLTFSGTTCCSQQPGPNLPAFPQTSSLSYKGATINLTKQSFGGDQTGAVMISKFIKPGTMSTVAYNHYAMLKSIEDIFGLDHLGYAAQPGLQGFGSDVFTNL
ncbi:alkaline phosphatase family protein [Burkholderia multivorans]|nr:alkaline phosphatase family protein [Burkholderia multivorans]MBU9142732.1 alkaline phosphatase family protein [Burkholderia multivorans]MBU9516006.1 alkaline phosphatase family protein [Burkholderia multivorans]MBU9524904.1 alkaline phosphatase family protein [Burkholderia multivorans]MBU9536357.1 alkaline phosphatase family protein [Burkholderia multivorans]MBU9636184.1 alkaline phosphatase family protein [Burkholderia multivorans]